MIETEVAQALTYANQIDPRVQLTDANVEVWWEGLRSTDVNAARWAIKAHYASQNANGEGAHVVNPATIRRLITAELQRRESKQRALEPPKGRAPNPMSWRQRNPEEFDRLMGQGAEGRYNELSRRGIKVDLPKHMQATVQDGGHSFATKQEQL